MRSADIWEETIGHQIDWRSSMGCDKGLFQVPADFKSDLPANLFAAFEGEAV
jgi:hypothetical protein